MLQKRGKMAEVMSCTREGNGAEQKPGEYTQWEDTLCQPCKSRQTSGGSDAGQSGRPLIVSIFRARQEVYQLSPREKTNCPGCEERREDMV